MIFFGLVGRGIAAAAAAAVVVAVVWVEDVVVQVGRREVTRVNQEDGAGGRGGGDISARESDFFVSGVNRTFFEELALGVRAKQDGVRGSGISSNVPDFDDVGVSTSKISAWIDSSSGLVMSPCMKW